MRRRSHKTSLCTSTPIYVLSVSKSPPTVAYKSKLAAVNIPFSTHTVVSLKSRIRREANRGDNPNNAYSITPFQEQHGDWSHDLSEVVVTVPGIGAPQVGCTRVQPIHQHSLTTDHTSHIIWHNAERRLVALSAPCNCDAYTRMC